MSVPSFTFDILLHMDVQPVNRDRGGIEISCRETAISVVNGVGSRYDAKLFRSNLQ